MPQQSLLSAGRLLGALLGVLKSTSASPNSSPCSFTLYHRLAPLDPVPNYQVPWTSRATLELDFFSASDSASGVFEARPVTVSTFKPRKAATGLILPANLNVTYRYQLTVIPSDSQPPSPEIGSSRPTAISSAPLCALDPSGLPGQQVQEYFNIWLRLKPSTTEKEGVASVTEAYDLMGINWATSKLCTLSPEDPDPHQLRRVSQSLENQGEWKTRLAVRMPESLPQPILRPYPVEAPPEILPDGSVKPPPKEQGWFAKYWMYLLPVVVLLLLGGGAPEEEGSQGAQGKS